MKELLNEINKYGKAFDIDCDNNTLTCRIDNIQSSARATLNTIAKRCGLFNYKITSKSSREFLGSTMVTLTIGS